MRIVHATEGIEIPLEENRISVLYIEDQRVLSRMASEFWLQSQGGDGGWILSEKEKTLDLSKETECIYNLFDINMNGTKAISIIHKNMLRTAREQMHLETGTLNNEIADYLENLAATEEYPLEFDLDLDVSAILKAYHVRFVTETNSLAEALVEYGKVMRRVLKKSLLVFLNLKQFISQAELELLYEDLLYEKIRVLLIEGCDYPRNKIENKYLIDSDRCIIRIED